LRLRQTPPVGTHAGIAPLVARRVAGLLREHGLDRHSVSLALVGHGTRRNERSRDATIALADTLRRRRVAGEVLAAFLDDDPPAHTLLERATLPHLVVVPFLIGGAHSAKDVPDLLELSHRRLTTDDWRLATRVFVDDPVGTYPGLVELVIDLARRHAPPPRPKFKPRGVCSRRHQSGAVHLVGAGPGDPGLITARGLELLRRADVVVHDRLIRSELLSEARPDSLLIDAGKRPGHAAYTQEQINAVLVEHAQQGMTVVRLKGGDPFVFGRGSEEVQACQSAGIEVYVVPGISSAIAGPAAAGIPVTARGVARSFTVITGHSADEGGASACSAATASSALSASSTVSADTLVILMGRANLATLAADLIASGRDPGTPTACIQSATTLEQRVTRATLATIAEAVERDGLESPVVTIIGEVAAMNVSGTVGQTERHRRQTMVGIGLQA
jgi:uroporphyrin-III C-methyltransferase